LRSRGVGEGEGEGEGLESENAKGRPRKPLAEVSLEAPRCAPLRLLYLVANRVPFLSFSKHMSGMMRGL
jgi:hypothetical protein